MSHPTVRILYVLNSADIYGASRSLLRVCQALDRARFEPLALVPETGPLIPMLEKAGVKVIQSPVSVVTRRVFKSWRLLPFLLAIPRAAWKLRQIVRQHRIDLVHTNVGTILSTGIGARLAGVPHAWHIRDWYGEFGGLWKWYRRYIIACSDMVVCVSHAIAAQFPSDPKVMVAHDGFPLEEFDADQARLRKEFRQKYSIDQDAIVAGCVGRIKFGRKGQEFLIQAAGILRHRKDINFVILIVGAPSPGSEEHLPRLRTLVEELGLLDRVVFTGELADTRPAYAASDLFVLPSAQPEPFGGVVIEAMAMGKPVIATAIGGSLDQVAEGETGFLIPPADPKALAEKMLILAEDPALRSRMGAAGIKRVRENFGLQRLVEQIETTYSELLAR